MYSLFHGWCPGQHHPRAVWVVPQVPALHRCALVELLPHRSQTPLICLSSSSRVQKPPSPMETGAGSNKTSHGISKAIRGNLTAFMIQVLAVSATHTQTFHRCLRHTRYLPSGEQTMFVLLPSPWIPPPKAARNCS